MKLKNELLEKWKLVFINHPICEGIILSIFIHTLILFFLFILSKILGYFFPGDSVQSIIDIEFTK